MAFPFDAERLAAPQEPIDAQQSAEWVSRINELTRTVIARWPGDPDVHLLLQFDEGFSDARYGTSPVVGPPVRIVRGRTGQAVRIEKPAVNLVGNPSFEESLEGWTTPDNAVSILRDAQHTYNGDGTVSVAAMRLQGQNRPAAPHAQSTTPVGGGRRYCASAWMFSPSPAIAELELEFTGGTPSRAGSSPVSLPPGQWSRVIVSDAASNDNTSATIRIRLAQVAPTFSAGSRVSAWAPTGTTLSTNTDLQIQTGDVMLAAVADDPASSGNYAFHLATATVPGPGDPAFRLDGGATHPRLAAGSRVSLYRPAPGDVVPVTDGALELHAGDLVFCKIAGRPHGFSMVTTGAVGASNPDLRLDDDGSPPDFDGPWVSRFAPDGTALVSSGVLPLAPGDIVLCHLVSRGGYDFVPVTTGGDGPVDLGLRLDGESTPPNLAVGSRLSRLAPTRTALATDTMAPLAQGDAILAYTVGAPLGTGYGFHMVTTGASGPADGALRVDDAPAVSEIWVDCVQLEEGRFPSSYVDPLQGPGYSGLAPATSRRKAGVLTYPLPSGLDPTVGSLSLWYRPGFDSTDGEAHFLADLAEAECRNRLSLRADVAGRLSLAIHDDQDGFRQVRTDASIEWVAGEWLHIAATWNAGMLRLHARGQTLPASQSGDGTGILGTLPETLHLGSSFHGLNQADGLLTDVILLGRELSPEEISALATSTTPYLPARNTLQPVDIPTLTHVKIGDFDVQVRTTRLDQMAAPAADLSVNGHRLISVADPASPQDAATRNYVDTQLGAINPMIAVGDVLYGGAGGAVTRLAANSSTRKKFLIEAGTGTAGNAPAWGTIGGGDLRDIYVSATGSANAYAATPNPAPSSMNTGMLFLVRIPVANTGASTLNLNNLGATPIRTQTGGDPAAGALAANGVYLMAYDGSAFQLV